MDTKETLGFDREKIGKRFDGKVAVITGGSKGIGQATALRLAAEWANIAITSSSDWNATDETIKKVRALSVLCIAFPCNVAKEEDVKVFFEQVMKEYGHIDTVIHCAGISPNTPFFDQTAEEWRDVLSTNLVGSFNVTQTALRVMKTLGHLPDRNIVLVGSTNGINSNDPQSAHYDSSKAGVNLLANTAAKLYPETGVRVNAIAPGWIDTGMNHSLEKKYRDTEIARIHMKRFARPSEVASSIAYLASSDASYVNGNVHMVDGGYN